MEVLLSLTMHRNLHKFLEFWPWKLQKRLMYRAVRIRTLGLWHENDNCSKRETKSFHFCTKINDSNNQALRLQHEHEICIKSIQNPSNFTMKITQIIHPNSRTLQTLRFRRENDKCTNSLTKPLSFDGQNRKENPRKQPYDFSSFCLHGNQNCEEIKRTLTMKNHSKS